MKWSSLFPFLLSSPLIYVVKGGGGISACRSTCKLGKITKTLAGGWLWCGGPLTHMATNSVPGWQQWSAAHRKSPAFCCMTQKALWRQRWMCLLSTSATAALHGPWVWNETTGDAILSSLHWLVQMHDINHKLSHDHKLNYIVNRSQISYYCYTGAVCPLNIVVAFIQVN